MSCLAQWTFHWWGKVAGIEDERLGLQVAAEYVMQAEDDEDRKDDARREERNRANDLQKNAQHCERLTRYCLIHVLQAWLL